MSTIKKNSKLYIFLNVKAFSRGGQYWKTRGGGGVSQRALNDVPANKGLIAVNRKKKSLIAYVSPIISKTSTKKIWERVKKIKGKIIKRPHPFLTNVSGIETQIPSETSNIFGEAFASHSEKNTLMISNFIR